MNHQIRIVIVEDDRLQAMAMKAVLTQWGYTRCQVVASGKEALVHIRREPPDLALIDITLADEMTGIALAQKIRDFSQAQVSFMTGYGADQRQEEVSAVQPLACLTKPLALDRVKTILESIASFNETNA